MTRSDITGPRKAMKPVNDSGVPAITIITPTYNCLDMLKECVQSVVSQPFQNWEMLISDDCSSDGTGDWLRTISDSRIHVFHQEKNLGIFGNLNFLFGRARASYAYVLCQDDYFTEDALTRVLSVWAGHSQDVGFIRFNWGESVRNHCYLSRYSVGVLPRVVDSSRSNLYFFLFGNLPGNLSNNSIRVNAWRDAGGFRTDLPYAGDFEFWSRLARMCQFAFSEECVTVVRRHPRTASVLLNKKGELISQALKVLSDLLERLRGEFPTWMLRTWLTMNCDVLHTDAGLRVLLKRGELGYLRALKVASKTNKFSIPSIGRLGLYLITAGGRIGRIMIVKRILRHANLPS